MIFTRGFDAINFSTHDPDLLSPILSSHIFSGINCVLNSFTSSTVNFQSFVSHLQGIYYDHVDRPVKRGRRIHTINLYTSVLTSRTTPLPIFSVSTDGGLVPESSRPLPPSSLDHLNNFRKKNNKYGRIRYVYVLKPFLFYIQFFRYQCGEKLDRLTVSKFFIFCF